MLSGLNILLSWLAFFGALRTVETGGHPDPRNAVGDGGKSIGPYQITLAYWQDAVDSVPLLAEVGDYEDCRRCDYAEAIMLAYWRRWCRIALADRDWQTLARTHNGGPRGHKKRATMP